MNYLLIGEQKFVSFCYF